MLLVAQSSDDVQNLVEWFALRLLVCLIFHQMVNVKFKLTDSYFSSSSVTGLVASCFSTKTVNKSEFLFVFKQAKLLPVIKKCR